MSLKKLSSLRSSNKIRFNDFRVMSVKSLKHKKVTVVGPMKIYELNNTLKIILVDSIIK